MHCHCFLRKRIVYIPTQGMMDKGLYLDIEPVAVVPLSNTEALRAAFIDVISRGNPVTPRPNPPEASAPLLPKYAGMKSWSTFARGTTTWAISERDDQFYITGYRKIRSGGWEPDPNTRETFPEGTLPAEVVDRMIAILEEAARADA